jgi:hypothetical protein
LNGSLTIPALIGQNIKLVSLQNNSILNVLVNANGNYSGVQFEYVFHCPYIILYIVGFPQVVASLRMR